jgi:hypothetical protein
MQIVADRRRRTVDPSPDRVRDARRTAAVYLDSRLDMAKALAALQKGGDHLLLGYGSLRDYATQVLRIPGSEVRNLMDLGQSLGLLAAPADPPVGTATDASGETPEDALFGGDEPRSSSPPPTIEDRVRDGALPTDNAAQLARLTRELGGLSEEEQARWSRLAETTPGWKFRGMVSSAIESAKQGRPTQRFETYVTESAMEDFRRAKVIGSKRAGRRLTDGQTLALIARRFVEREDERYVGEKKRRVAHTNRVPSSRFVPAEVRRGIAARGGAREIDDLARGCTNHHLLLDAGLIRFVGFDAWKRPLFRARDGRLIQRSPPGWANGATRTEQVGRGHDPPEP